MAISYNIYRDGVLVGTSSTPAFTEHITGGTHQYQVTAVNEYGEGPPATVNVTVPLSLIWDGSAWRQTTGTYQWTGTQWVPWTTTKAWDGTKWRKLV